MRIRRFARFFIYLFQQPPKIHRKVHKGMLSPQSNNLQEVKQDAGIKIQDRSKNA